jgi:PIF1-like helicase
LLATRCLKAQKNLHHSFLLILPSLITSLGVDVYVLLYLMILLIMMPFPTPERTTLMRRNQYEAASQHAADNALQDARLPNNDGARDENPDDIGNGDFDCMYDWSVHIDRYPDITANYWDGLRDTHSDQLMPLVVGSADTLQPEQRCVYVMKLYGDFVEGLNPPPMRINIDGPAGTGKSYLIDMISVHLRSWQADLVVRGAPTGIAAFNIRGRTIHSLLRLPVRKAFEPLAPTSLAACRRGSKPAGF